MPTVKKALIKKISEISFIKDGRKKLLIDVQFEHSGKIKTFSVMQAKKYAFDLIKNFEAKRYEVGDVIDFRWSEPLFSTAYPAMWQIYNVVKGDKVPDEEYHIRWTIEAAGRSFKDAARKALDMIRDDDTTALIFDVTNTETGESEQIDLTDEQQE